MRSSGSTPGARRRYPVVFEKIKPSSQARENVADDRVSRAGGTIGRALAAKAEVADAAEAD